MPPPPQHALVATAGSTKPSSDAPPDETSSDLSAASSPSSPATGSGLWEWLDLEGGAAATGNWMGMATGFWGSWRRDLLIYRGQRRQEMDEKTGIGRAHV